MKISGITANTNKTFTRPVLNSRKNNLGFSGINMLPKKIIIQFQKNNVNRFAKYAEIGEGSSIFLDFIGKFAIVPAMIIFNPFSKEDKDSKTYSALKNPLGAGIQFITEVAILSQLSNRINKLAKAGKLGSSYNIAKLSGPKLAEAHTKLNLFNNRVCLAVALASTPIVCAIENWLHPKIMKALFPNKQKTKKLPIIANNLDTRA